MPAGLRIFPGSLPGFFRASPEAVRFFPKGTGSLRHAPERNSPFPYPEPFGPAGSNLRTVFRCWWPSPFFSAHPRIRGRTIRIFRLCRISGKTFGGRAGLRSWAARERIRKQPSETASVISGGIRRPPSVSAVRPTPQARDAGHPGGTQRNGRKGFMPVLLLPTGGLFPQ